MNGSYMIYRRDPATGIRSELLERYTEFSINLNWGEVSKFQITGTTIGKVELEPGDGLVWYRNGVKFFCGIVDSVEVECADTAADLKTWTADGFEDSVIFARWLAFADPAMVTFAEGVVDKYSGYADERQLHYIRYNMGPEALAGRVLDGLTVPAANSIGQDTRSAYRYEPLDQVVQEIGAEEEDGQPNNCYPRFVWDPDTGAKSVVIETQRDRTDILIAPEFSNIARWTRTKTLPTCNAVWVCSGDFKDPDDEEKEIRIWVSAEDAASIAKYGRFEKVVTASDVKVGTYDDVTTTEAEAYDLLNNEAAKALSEGAAVTKFSGDMVETPELRFMTDWQCGDLVTCIIDGESFATTIKTVEIKYAEGFEEVTPTLGECEHGQLSEIFKQLRGLDTRMREEELN